MRPGSCTAEWCAVEHRRGLLSRHVHAITRRHASAGIPARGSKSRCRQELGACDMRPVCVHSLHRQRLTHSTHHAPRRRPRGGRAHHDALGGARRRCEPARSALRVAVEHDVPGRTISARAAGGQLRERARERRVASALAREVPGAARGAICAMRAALLSWNDERRQFSMAPWAARGKAARQPSTSGFGRVTCCRSCISFCQRAARGCFIDLCVAVRGPWAGPARRALSNSGAGVEQAAPETALKRVVVAQGLIKRLRSAVHVRPAAAAGLLEVQPPVHWPPGAV